MKTLKEKAETVLAFTFGGLYNVPGKTYDKGRRLEVNLYGGISTYDNDNLTKLVIKCHEECVRMEICSSGPRMVKLVFTNRNPTGDSTERHPRIHDVLTKYGIVKMPPEVT